MVATGSGHIQRLCWDGSINYSYCVDLRRVPFCDDQLVMKGKFVKPLHLCYPWSKKYAHRFSCMRCIVVDFYCTSTGMYWTTVVYNITYTCLGLLTPSDSILQDSDHGKWSSISLCSNKLFLLLQARGFFPFYAGDDLTKGNKNYLKKSPSPKVYRKIILILLW